MAEGNGALTGVELAAMGDKAHRLAVAFGQLFAEQGRVYQRALRVRCRHDQAGRGRLWRAEIRPTMPLRTA